MRLDQQSTGCFLLPIICIDADNYCMIAIAVTPRGRAVSVKIKHLYITVMRYASYPNVHVYLCINIQIGDRSCVRRSLSYDTMKPMKLLECRIHKIMHCLYMHGISSVTISRLEVFISVTVQHSVHMYCHEPHVIQCGISLYGNKNY